MALPKFGVAYDFQVSLGDALSSNFLVNPTIITGDFKLSKDDGALFNLLTTPLVTPSGSVLVKILLAAVEMEANKIAIVGIDSGSLWDDITIIIDVPTGNIDTINDLLEGDISESSTGVIIKKKGTSTEILNKTITGSLLSTSVTVTTAEP